MSTKLTRSSNIELFRVILMIMIVTHHYVVNSGISSFFNYNSFNVNMLFAQFIGWGGKTGINCFLLISGYFMCKQQFRWKKLLKLYLQVKFYNLLFYFCFLGAGYNYFSVGELFRKIFGVINGLNGSFIGGFFALYLVSSFINILIKELNQKQHAVLIGILLLIYSISSTFFLNANYEYLPWYTTVYLIGAFIRIYPLPIFQDKQFSRRLVVISLILVYLSIILIDIFCVKSGKGGFYTPFYMVSDSNKILAILCAVSLFLLFKNITIRQNRVINILGASTFGVFLIHANCDEMRKFLWVDIFKNTLFFNSQYFFIHAFLTVIIVYVVCTIIDIFRIYFLEKPLFKLIDSLELKCKDRCVR